MKILFLHGLDSSSQGTKGRFFRRNFPEIIAPDFQGSLQDRLHDLEKICTSKDKLLMIGSSFGGLMATCYAEKHPTRVRKLILLAPALNFPDFCVPDNPISIPTMIIIGKKDTVTPPRIVVPHARKSFSNLTIEEVDDDHMLHKTYSNLDWKHLLS